MEPAYPDFLISNRISINSLKIEVNYYKPEELYAELKWYKKPFVDCLALTNRKNVELFYQAMRIAEEKHLRPCFPALSYVW